MKVIFTKVILLMTLKQWLNSLKEKDIKDFKI